MEKKRILIVDDDLALSQAIRLNLEDGGEYEVQVENHSANAVATVRAFSPDLILLDYVMPGADGGDVSRQIHEDPALQRIPIIMVTALLSNSETGESGSVIRNGHVMMAKPIKLAKLRRCIEEQLAASAGKR